MDDNIIDLMRQDFSPSVFGKEKDDSFRSSIAQIGKGFDEVDFYPSIEEKAATLRYLIIKNHSFVNGNKRIASSPKMKLARSLLRDRCFRLNEFKNGKCAVQRRKPTSPAANPQYS